MKTIISFYIILLFGQTSFAQTYCTNPDFEKEVHSYLKNTIPYLSCDELAYETSEYIILDAREKEEYDTSHIPNAKYVGYHEFNIELISKIPKDHKIVVYCSIGYRSEKIGEKLQAYGFENVYNLFGSIFEWVNQDRQVVDSNDNNVFIVHSYNKKWSKWIDNKNFKISY